MTISSNTRTAGPFIGTGVLTTYPFAFKVFNTTDVSGVITSALGVDTALANGADFTVVLNPDQNANPGGTISYVPNAGILPLNAKLNFTSNLNYFQTLLLTNLGSFLPTVINDAFDRVVILTQQILTKVNASLQFPLSDGTGISNILPNKAARLGKVQAYDATTGAPVMSNLTLAQLESGTTSSAASAAAAAASASASSGSASSALTYLQAFRDQYYGAAASDPTQDPDGNVPTAGDLYFNTASLTMMVYTGAAWAAAILPSNFSYLGATGGTSSLITATPSPALISYQTGIIYLAKITTGNVTNASLNVSGLGAKNIFKHIGGSTLVQVTNNDLPITGWCFFTYDGTQFILMNPPSFSTGTSLASAATVNIGGSSSESLQVSGTTTITAFTLLTGVCRKVTFTGALRIVNSGTLICPGGQDLYTTGGDVAIIQGESGGVSRIMSFLPAASVFANPNFLIGGNFSTNPWQRGNNINLGASSGYTADRWRANRSASVTGMNVSKDTFGTGSVNGTADGMRCQRIAADAQTNTLTISQDVLSSNSRALQGQFATLTFWAKCGANYSAASSILNAIMQYGTGTDQAIISGYTGATTVMNTNITLTTSWQKFTIVTTAAIAAAANQVGVIFTMTPTGTAGANDWFELANIKLEAGVNATPFPYERAEDVLDQCQYYYQTLAGETINDSLGMGYGFSTSQMNAHIGAYPRRMRAAPTIAFAAAGNYVVNGNGTANTVTAISLGSGGGPASGLAATVTAATLGAGGVYTLRTNSTAGLITFNAEI